MQAQGRKTPGGRKHRACSGEGERLRGLFEVRIRAAVGGCYGGVGIQACGAWIKELWVWEALKVKAAGEGLAVAFSADGSGCHVENQLETWKICKRLENPKGTIVTLQRGHMRV